jgi:hypothetical protein
MRKWTIGALRTETGNEKRTGSPSDVSVSAAESVLAEAPCVPKTFFDSAVRVNVQVHALWVTAFSVLAEEPAFGHLFQVEFVQKLARFALFAQATKPMLADNRLFMDASVFEGAGGALCTGAFEEETANVSRLSGTGAAGSVSFALQIYAQFVADIVFKIKRPFETQSPIDRRVGGSVSGSGRGSCHALSGEGYVGVGEF